MDPNLQDKEESESTTSKKNINEEYPNKKKPDDFGGIRFTKTSKNEDKFSDVFSFMKENTKDTIAYVLLIAGILMMFFDSVSIYGGLIVGIIFGLYFAKELAYLVTNAAQLVEEEGLPKSLMFSALLLIVLLKVPFMFIGAAIVAVLKAFFVSEDNSKNA